MKRYILALIGIFWILPVTSIADDFLGAPLIPSGEVVQKTGSRMEMKTTQSHDDTLAFYKKALKDYTDIKFRDWKDATYIEDDGNLAWHSITISKGHAPQTTISIMKDSWTWIIGTLVIRYIGVFVVLVVLLLGMSLSGSIISRAFKK
ncbi:MAG: hypothetical protein JW932_15340 [Deltaproteobacteria bacterium]|nr:hypothetical protein [Deltaproteobacteria bacterium]